MCYLCNVCIREKSHQQNTKIKLLDLFLSLRKLKTIVFATCEIFLDEIQLHCRVRTIDK